MHGNTPPTTLRSAPARRNRPALAWRAGRGFTLVEVLVALLIMSVIAAMGWQGVSAMATARERTAAVSERVLRLQTVIAQWEQDLASVYDSPRVPGLHFDGAALRLVRRSDEGARLVVWALREGTWTRWASPVYTSQTPLEQAWNASFQLQGQEPGQLKLLEGVGGWQLYCFIGQAWANCQSTGDLAAQPGTGTPPAPGPGGGAGGGQPRAALPSGVRLQIELPEGRLLRDVVLPPQA